MTRQNQGARAPRPDGREGAHHREVRVDLHCHSRASSGGGPAGRHRPLELPECATPPDEVLELARRRGMDFVTITDHDTIAGVLEIAAEPDVFVSEELTAWFPGEPQAVHVLCLGITADDHDWLQAHRGDVHACAAYLHERELACALAHPFAAVAAPLTPAHRRTLAELFPIWETRNGGHPPAVNAPAAIYIETHGGVAIGGSDDHAGIDVGRTWTKAPFAATPAELLAHVRAGSVTPHGHQGGPAKATHGSLVLAARALAAGRPVAHMSVDEGRRLLREWLAAVDPDLTTSSLLDAIQGDEFDHGELERRARRAHERRLQRACSALGAGAAADAAGAALFDACLPALPYLPAATRMARQSAALRDGGGDRPRVAILADGLEVLPGLADTVAQLRDRGVPGFELEVIGTDAGVDRRLPAVAELRTAYLPEAALGVPSLLAIAAALTERRYDLIHVCGPGPCGIAALAIAWVRDVPVTASVHAELPAGVPVERFLRGCVRVLSPSRFADQQLRGAGVTDAQLVRWEPGVDLGRFTPACYSPDAMPAGGAGATARINVLYAGSLTATKGVGLLADAFLLAHDRDPRLHLVLAGRGPEEQRLRRRLGSAATFLGWLDSDELARTLASAELFVLASATETFGRIVLEAQASGLPVLAVDAGGGAELIESGRTGCLVEPSEPALAEAMRWLARRATLRERLATGGLLAVRQRTWERSLGVLANGWSQALVAGAAGGAEVEVARVA